MNKEVGAVKPLDFSIDAVSFWQKVKRRFNELVAAGATKETAFDTAVIDDLERRLAALDEDENGRN